MWAVLAKAVKHPLVRQVALAALMVVVDELTGESKHKKR